MPVQQPLDESSYKNVVNLFQKSAFLVMIFDEPFPTYFTSYKKYSIPLHTRLEGGM